MVWLWCCTCVVVLWVGCAARGLRGAVAILKKTGNFPLVVQIKSIKPSINDDESGGASPSAAAGNNNKATNGGNTKTNTVSAGGGKGEGTDGETSDDVDDEEGGVARTIGGVVGGIAAVVLVGGCLVYAVHSRRKSAARALDKPAIPTEKQQQKRGAAPDLPPRPGNLEKRVEMFKFTNEHFERSPPPTPAED